MVMMNQIKRGPTPKDSMGISAMGVSAIKSMNPKMTMQGVMKKPIADSRKANVNRNKGPNP